MKQITKLRLLAVVDAIIHKLRQEKPLPKVGVGDWALKEDWEVEVEIEGILLFIKADRKSNRYAAEVDHESMEELAAEKG